MGRTSLFNNVRAFSLMGLLSLHCQLAWVDCVCGAAVEGRCFILDLISSQDISEVGGGRLR